MVRRYVLPCVVVAVLSSTTTVQAERPRYFGFYEGQVTVTTSPYYPSGTYTAEAAVSETDSGVVGYVNIVFDPQDSLGGIITHAFSARLESSSNTLALQYQDRVCGAGDPIGKCYPHDPTDTQYSFEGDASFVNGKLILHMPSLLPGLPYAATLPFDSGELTRRQNETRASFEGTYQDLDYIWMGTLILPTPLPLNGSNTVDIQGGQIVSWLQDGVPLPPGVITDSCFDDARGLGWMNQQGTWFYYWMLHPEGEGVSVFVTFDDVTPNCADLQDPLAGLELDRVHGDLVGSMFERSPAASGPGRVEGLTVDRSAGALDLAWQPDCGNGMKYSVYRGNLALGYDSLVAESCNVNGTTVSISEGAGAADFFLVVPNRQNKEGSYGLDSRNIRRALPTNACYPQGAVDSCAP